MDRGDRDGREGRGALIDELVERKLDELNHIELIDDLRGFYKEHYYGRLSTPELEIRLMDDDDLERELEGAKHAVTYYEYAEGNWNKERNDRKRAKKRLRLFQEELERRKGLR